MAPFIGVIRSFLCGRVSSSHSFDELVLLSAAEGASLKQVFLGSTKQSQLPGSCMFILLPLFAEIVTYFLKEHQTNFTLPQVAFFTCWLCFLYAIRSLEKSGKVSRYSNNVKLFRKAVSEDTLVLITQPEF